MKMQTAERSSAQDPSENPIFQRHMIAYRTAAGKISGKVLEVGCGEGYGVPVLAASVDEYLGLDKYAPQVPNLPKNAKIIQTEVPPFTGIEDNSQDFVVSFQVIEHIENDLAFLKEIYRVLKPGGTLYLTTPNREMSLTRNPWHVREYTLSEMEAIVIKAFGSVNLQGVFGNEKVMQYYEENKASVQKFTRWDILNLQYRLPRWMLQIPYDIANRMNRRKLKDGNQGLVSSIEEKDYFIAPATKACLDWFVEAKKPL